MQTTDTSNKSWYSYIPHPVVMLLGIIVLVTLITYILPSGLFERIEVDGRMRVVPGSYRTVPSTPVSLLQMFTALPIGFSKAAGIIYVILSGGIMFGALQKTGAIENAVGQLIHKLGEGAKSTLIIGCTFLFGFLGVAVGYEHNIAMVPLAAFLSLAIGGDLILAAGMSVAALTIGFGVSPFNIYTVGIGHKIAELPIFSGWILRSALTFICLLILSWWNLKYFNKIKDNKSKGLGADLNEDGFKLTGNPADYSLSTRHVFVVLSFVIAIGAMLYGIFYFDWFLNEISAVFLMAAICFGIIGGINPNEQAKEALKSIALVAPGAFLVGLANAVRVVLETGQIADTITFHLADFLTNTPPVFAAIGMVFSQSLMNFLIPSGSGQALATLPVMIPLGDLVGVTRQVTVLAFQIGDGLTNIVNPTLGGLVAMLSMCRVPFDRWLQFILPLTIRLMVFAIIVLTLCVLLGFS